MRGCPSRTLLCLALTVLGRPEASGQDGSSAAFRKDAELVVLSPGGTTRVRLDVEIAERAEDRIRGLMFRESLEENQGMLFVFPDEKPLSFWMKDTPLPLDIIFLDDEQTIVFIREHTIPFSEGPILSDRPARYVIEVNAGFAGRHRLAPGDRAFWQRL